MNRSVVRVGAQFDKYETYEDTEGDMKCQDEIECIEISIGWENNIHRKERDEYENAWEQYETDHLSHIVVLCGEEKVVDRSKNKRSYKRSYECDYDENKW